MERTSGAVILVALIAAGPVAAQGLTTQDPAAELHRIFDDVWEFRLEDDPGFATSAGDHRYDHRLRSMSPKAQERRAAHWRTSLERLQRIDRAALGGEDRISYDMLVTELRDELAEHEFGGARIPLTVDSGFQIGFARLGSRMPLRTVRDYENYLSRLRAFPAQVDEHLALMREGLRTGWTLPRVVLEGLDGTVSAHVVDDPARSVFHVPFDAFPATVPEADRERLRSAGRAAIVEAVVPGYRALLHFLTKEYMPGARATTGCSDMPGGQAYYAHLVRHYTTLDVTPEQVHRIGVAEVARIRKEMDEVIRQAGFRGDFAAFLEFLRTDPRFYAASPEALLKEAAWIAKRMDGKLPALFRTLPKQPYGLEPVPDDLAPKFTGGRYVSAPAEGTRAGMYWLNTYALSSRPLYILEALTLHEAVPGHHLQNALRHELAGLPKFRRHASVTAYGEGWGLYAERLGLEAGFYRDPYSNFGRLTYEMWRACRLVVDTGLHALGWSRQQALDFLASNTALSLHEVRTETDRYISWPGQALAYKMGELKLRELRRHAEEALGDRFDVRAFHDTVLLSGPVPLSVLDEQVRTWVEAERSAR